MFCSKCGKEIDDDATFCTFCGLPQDPIIAAGQNRTGSASENSLLTSQVVIGILRGADTEIAFANGLFISNGQTLTAQKLAELDGLGLIDWKSDEMKLLTLSQANHTAQPAPALNTPEVTGYEVRSTSVPTTSPAALAPQQKERGFTGERDGRIYLNGVDVSYENAYWQEEFTKIYESNGTYTGKFNWAAFLGFWIWAFVKNLPEVGGIGLAATLILGILTYGIGGLPVCIWLGIRGNYIRYKQVIEHEKIYF